MRIALYNSPALTLIFIDVCVSFTGWNAACNNNTEVYIIGLGIKGIIVNTLELPWLARASGDYH